MSSGDDLGGFSFTELAKHWYLDLSASGYEQEDNFLREDGQTQAQFNSAYNLSLEPDEALDLELEPTLLAKRHTMPDFGVSQNSPSTDIKGLAQLATNSPKRAETYPSTLEGLNIARNQRLIEDLLSKIDPGTTSTSPESDSQTTDTTGVAQSLPVNPIADLGCEEWPVPTFFLDHIDGPSPPGLDHTDDLTPDEPENSPKPFANLQSQDIEYTQTNDLRSMAEDLDSVPPLKSPSYHKVPNSDSGIGSSTMSYRRGPQSIMASSYKHTQSRRGGKSSTRGSQAKASVMLEKGSISGFTTTGLYQQVAAKLGPLTSAASSTARSDETQRMLSEAALTTMKTIILEPILSDIKFHDFWHICIMAGEQMETGQIGSLRDLEKFLFHKASNQQNNQAYNIFCKEFLSHVRESLKYMPQNELLRSYDRPYDTGYFLDIMARFNKSTMPEDDEEFNQEFEKWLHSTKSQPEKRVVEEHAEDDNFAKRHKPNRPALTIPVNDQPPFGHGGYDHISIVSENDLQDFITTPLSSKPGLMGPPALPASALNPPIGIAQIQHARSKVRRRGPGHQQKEPQFYYCKWSGCQHEPFNRACDLTKHEKTHTRPHKCSFAGCKYATEGFPTEKERDRHWTDKHSQETPSYHCQYPPCTYKSKRDSNCKQHMEKAHGYQYVRMKQNYKTNGNKRQSASPTSPTSQGSPVGPSQAKQDNSVIQARQLTHRYQTTDCQSSIPTGFPPGRGELYSIQDVENLRNLLTTHNQTNGHIGHQEQHELTRRNNEHNLTTNNFGHQGFMHTSPGNLPYPDAMDPSFLFFTPMPDANIDPDLQFMEIGVDGRMDLTSDEARGLISYSDTVT